MGEGTRWLIGLTVSVAALIIAWLAWQHPKSYQAANPGTSVTPTVATTPLPTEGELAYGQLRVGDCLAGSNLAHILPTSNFTWPNSVEALSCIEPHIAEVYFANDSYWEKNKSYPGDNSVDSTGNAICENAFKSYVGISYGNSIYNYTDVVPSSAGWPEGDRSLLCVAFYQNSGNSGAVVLDQSVKGVDK
jgi:putative regulator of septum formation